jgi:protein-disulfide isomerase
METKTLFDAMNPKTAFGIGFVSAILVTGTVGFMILGGCFLKGNCSNISAQNAQAELAVAKADDTAEAVQAAADKPTSIPVVSSADHVRGDENAAITIIEYSDFECPYCSKFHATMQQVMENYGGKVRWVYRHFPLSFHANAQSASEASECASAQGKFWEYADKLVENRASLGEETYLKIAQELGLNTTTFQSCLANGEGKSAVTTMYQGGIGAGVTGTPASFIIDSKGAATPIKGALPYETVKAMLDEALTQ